MIASLTTAFIGGIQANPDVPDAVKTQAPVELSAGVPFVSDADLDDALDAAGVPPATADAIVDENADARLVALARRGRRARTVRARGAVVLAADPDAASRARPDAGARIAHTTVSVTSTLPRVALEYGHTVCALATTASAASRSMLGA